MIVYLFNNDIFQTLTLPHMVSGMFSLYDDDKLVAMISSKDDKWALLLSDEFKSDMSGELFSVNQIVTISSNITNKSYYLFTSLKYDANMNYYNFDGTLTIGTKPECDIYYPIGNIEEVLKVIPTENNKFCLETNSNNFFVSKQRVKSGMILENGDYIFYYGLKVIIIGNIIIVNNPNNHIIFNNRLIRKNEEVDYKNNSVVKETLPLFNKDDYFFKAPRFNFIVEEEIIDIDEPPQEILDDDTPILLTIGPQLTLVSTSIISMFNFLYTYLCGEANFVRLIISLLTTGVTILGAILWPTLTRKINKKRTRKKELKRQLKYNQYLDQKERQINLIKDNQKSIIMANNPSSEQCKKIIENKTKELWQRGIDHDDFLSIRLGVGNVKSKIKVEVPKSKFTVNEEDKLFTRLQDITTSALTMNDVPITYRFSDQRISAIVGEEKNIKNFLDCVFLQIMTFHAYTDLKIVTYTNNPDNYDYLKILPHSWNNQKSMRYFSTSIEELSAISNELEKIFDDRVSGSENEKLEDDGTTNIQSNVNFKDFRPYYLFFIDDIDSARNISLINKILHYKRNMGFSIIITDQSISTLPSETSDFICLDDKESAIVTSNINDNQKLFKADYNDMGQINVYKYAQILANTPMIVEKEKYELPSSLSFLELYNVGRVEQLNSLSRWQDNNPILSLSVPVGIDQNGEIFKMDIHEKEFGPHGLVAGTTGSGKSEWIITYILSLAVNFSPEEVQFVLIDYKGGGLAKSFENQELGIKLPHLAGTVTNLDTSEIYRSIAAIESELKRRQEIFNEAREKLKEGSMNIYKYQQYYRKGLVSEPLSHLLIICDEFAELKSQQPEFMEQLISTSRIGRSLGIHLILATQKPSGVVNDQIWSNSKFKVCLKVQDKSDSNEMIKKPDAAFLKQTGAFYLQVGNDDYFNLGQSAWAGAKYFPTDSKKHNIDESISYIDNLGKVIGFYEEKENQILESKGEELINIVGYISDVSKHITIKSKPLWLENVKSDINLEELINKYNFRKESDYSYNIPVGEYDEPRRQEQGILSLDLSQGNIGIIGQNNTGEQLVSTIIWSSLCQLSPDEIAYYIIDFGAETLKKFAKFPQVGEVVFQDEVEKVSGIIDLLYEEFEKRKDLLSDYNGSFNYYNQNSSKKLPLIVTVINDYDVFLEILPKCADLINTLLRDSSKLGIIFILNGSSSNSIRQRQMQYLNHFIMMEFMDDSLYRLISNCRKGLLPKKVFGRGICKLDSKDADSYCEFQTAFIAPPESEYEVIKAFADKCVEFYKTKVTQLATIPDDTTSEDFIKYITELSNIPVGNTYYEKNVAKYNLLSNKFQLISAKKIEYNMNFIYGLANILGKMPNVKVRVIDLLNIFKEPILDIKIFNEDLDVVFAALEKDCLNRKATEDYCVNLIIGAGRFKKKLSKAGIEIATNLFNNVINSKQAIYILIDDYEYLRTLKLENWFKDVNVQNGIWLGEEFSNQTLFENSEVQTQDKKHKYDGLAFVVDNKNYTVIKTYMDGDK